MTMDKLKALMSRKIGGVPVLYLVAGLVIVLAVVAWRMKPAADVADEQLGAEDGGEPVDGDGDGGPVPPFVANPPPAYTVPSPDPNGTPTADDNDKWMRRSIEWLAGQGHASADVATIALQKYLGGEQLSVAEGKLRDLAIKHFGLPPDIPTSGGTETPAPVPNTPVPVRYIAPGYHTVTGPSNDSYTDMARLFYGRTDNDAIDLIQSYNVSHGHQGPFPVGTRFWIPKYQAPKYVKATANMRTTAQIIAKNPPLNSVKMLQELNDGMKFPVAVGTRVRVA